MLPSQLAGDRSLAPVMTSHGCEQEGLRKLVEAANPPGHTEEMIVPLIYPEGDFPVTPWGKATFYGVCQSATIMNQKAWITIK